MKRVSIALALLFVFAAVVYVFGHFGTPTKATLAEETLSSRLPSVKTARTKKCKCYRNTNPELRAIIDKYLKNR